MERPALNLPTIEIEYELHCGNTYLVFGPAGIFQAATHALGHGVCKVHTDNPLPPSKEYARVMDFEPHPTKTYEAIATVDVVPNSAMHQHTLFSQEEAARIRKAIRKQ